MIFHSDITLAAGARRQERPLPALVKICYLMKPAADISSMILFAKLSAKTELVMFAKPDAEVLASMMKAL